MMQGRGRTYCRGGEGCAEEGEAGDDGKLHREGIR